MRNIGTDIPVKINPAEHKDIMPQLIGYANVLCEGILCVLHFHKAVLLTMKKRDRYMER